MQPTNQQPINPETAMHLCFQPTPSITLDYQPVCLRVRWRGGKVPLFWFSPNGLHGDRMIPLPPVRSIKFDIAQRELVIIYMANVANDNQ